MILFQTRAIADSERSLLDFVSVRSERRFVSFFVALCWAVGRSFVVFAIRCSGPQGKPQARSSFFRLLFLPWLRREEKAPA
jgi:hypothetical protein